MSEERRRVELNVCTFARGTIARKETIGELSASDVMPLEGITHRQKQGYIREVWRSAMPTGNEQSEAHQSICVDTILGSNRARTDTGIANKRTLNPTGRVRTPDAFGKDKTVGRTGTKQDCLDLLEKAGRVADLMVRH